MNDIKLLDCTLRDGGYLNDWEFGENNILNVFERLVSAGVDIIEVGFIDENRAYDANRTIFPNAESINKTYGRLAYGNSIIVGMIDYGTCSINNMIPCKDSILDGIRVIFKEQDMYEALSYCRKIKELGYKTFVQAVSITSYTDKKLEELINHVNDLEPYAFSLVDTYGLLHKASLMHYYKFAIQHLKKAIGIGYHSHNNFQLAFANCIELLEEPPEDRVLIVDGSLYGMGKSAGNAPTELLAMYMNEKLNKCFDHAQLLEAIDVTILELFKKIPWGYNFKFFVAASHDCHPSYVTYLMDKKKLSIKSIHEILEKIVYEKKLLYDNNHIENLYIDYQKNECDDAKAIKKLKSEFSGKKVLLMGPGQNVENEKHIIEDFIKDYKPVKIAVNFFPVHFKPEYIFISNAKRYVQMFLELSENIENTKIIATSNVTKTSGDFDYEINYSSFLDDKALIVDNPLIMLIKVLKQSGVEEIILAGFDGYATSGTSDYINPNMEYFFSKEKAEAINNDVINSLERLNLSFRLRFLTESKYDRDKMS